MAATNGHKNSVIEENIGHLPSGGEIIVVQMDHIRSRYPYCIVWTPIPVLTWLFPFIGHMGIAMSSGVIRDFAGPYYVSEDEMAFGKPTKYLIMDPHKAMNGSMGWDRAVIDASEEYKNRMHNLIFDNCHSHVAMALNLMHYDNQSSWNMIKLAFKMFIFGKFVDKWSIVKTYFPFFIVLTILMMIFIFLF